MEDTCEWTGEWPPFLRWLDSLTRETTFRIPFGSTPPITKTGDNLMVRNKGNMFVVRPSESIRFDKKLGEFFKA